MCGGTSTENYSHSLAWGEKHHYSFSPLNCLFSQALLDDTRLVSLECAAIHGNYCLSTYSLGQSASWTQIYLLLLKIFHFPCLLFSFSLQLPQGQHTGRSTGARSEAWVWFPSKVCVVCRWNGLTRCSAEMPALPSPAGAQISSWARCEDVQQPGVPQPLFCVGWGRFPWSGLWIVFKWRRNQGWFLSRVITC